MKYIKAVLVLVMLSTGLLYAQEFNTPKKTTITGDLSLVQGTIAIQKDGITYFISGLRHLVGFVDGLKEGATVTLEGYASPVRQGISVMFRATKLTFGTKDYELASPYLGGEQMRTFRQDAPGQRALGWGYQGRRMQQRQYPRHEQRRYQNHRYF